MQTEQAVRAEIVAAGYACTLETMARPELNFADSQSLIARFVTDVEVFLLARELCETKAVNVRLLCEKGD